LRGAGSDGVGEAVLVAHGTRTRAGVRTIGELAGAVSARIGRVHTAFVDVVGPNPAEVLANLDTPAIVVPAFLASGYHVRADLPAQIAKSGHRRNAVTPALGPDPALARVMSDRLIEVGWRPGDAVVMAAAGSADPVARRELHHAAALLAELVGEVHLGCVATGTPTVREVVDRLRAEGNRRTFIASYLLAPGLFHRRLRDCGASGVAAPLGMHPAVVDLIVSRFAGLPTA
jgi:sirohydrochlorin ferrochelatase